MKKFITLINSSWKLAASILGIAGIGWGAYAWQDSRKESEESSFEKVFEKLDVVTDKQDSLKQVLQMQEVQLEEISTRQKTQGVHMKRQDAHMKNMESAAKFYLNNQEEVTKEAMEEAIEIILEKQSENESEIVFEPIDDE